jgi:hypothetical protein
LCSKQKETAFSVAKRKSVHIYTTLNFWVYNELHIYIYKTLVGLGLTSAAVIIIIIIIIIIINAIGFPPGDRGKKKTEEKVQLADDVMSKWHLPAQTTKTALNTDTKRRSTCNLVKLKDSIKRAHQIRGHSFGPFHIIKLLRLLNAR